MKKKFSDESGWVRVVVCFAALLIHHGLRDALITALPTLATTTNSTTVTPTPKSIHITPSTQVNSNLTTTSRTIHMTPSTQATSTTFTPTPKSIHMTPSTQATSTTLTTTPRSIHMTPSTQANQVTTKENVENVENVYTTRIRSTTFSTTQHANISNTDGKQIANITFNDGNFKHLASIISADGKHAANITSTDGKHLANITFTDGKQYEKTSPEENNMIATPHTLPSSYKVVDRKREPDEATPVMHSTHTNITFTDIKQYQETSPEEDSMITTDILASSYKVVDTERKPHEAKTVIHSTHRHTPSLANSHKTSTNSYQSGITNLLITIPSLKQIEKTNSDDRVLKSAGTSDSVGTIVTRLPWFAFRVGKEEQRSYIHRARYRTVWEDLSALYKLKSEIPGRGKVRGGNVHAVSSLTAHVNNWISRLGGDARKEEEEDVGGKNVHSPALQNLQFKEEWSVVVEGVVLSSVFWGWLVAALLADLIIDRGGAARVLCVSVGVTGLAGLVTHAASLGGPWAMLGLRVVQGTVQGVSYPAVVRVLEGVPTAARAPAALLVFMGPPLGTGLGAGLGSLREWYLATYLVGSLGLVLAPLCLMLPPPPDATPHKEMHLSRVLRCRGVWACVGVHAATTWALHTLLVGVSFCLAHTHLDNPAASGWVVAAVAVVACGAARGMLFFAAKYSGKGPSTALNRRRVPVVAGTVMVTAAVIAMATAGLNAVEVLVGVGVGLAGLGVGVARAGYRLNVDDMAPRGAWRVTRVLDITAVVTAAMCPVVVAALAQAGGGGWVGVWLVPLAALLPAAAVHCFLLTSNPQPWDHTDKTTAANTNGAAGGVAPTLSVGRRQSFKSARSALTFKSARSRSRTRTMSLRTVDDELEGDMYSVASISVECRSVEDEPDQECVSVASSSTFKSDGADMHSVVDETNATNNAAATKQGGRQFGSMLVNGATTDRTSAWLSSHHDLDLETAGHPAVSASPSRADTHATNAIYGLLW